MELRGLYFVLDKSAFEVNGGINNKICAQIESFNLAGLNCNEYVFPIKKGVFYSLKWRLPFFNVYPVWEFDNLFSAVDYIYMRRPLVINKFLISLLKKIRSSNPSIKLLIEIPTYPYDLEYDSYKFCEIIKKTDIKYRNQLMGIVNYLVTVTDDDEIFGVKTIKIKNGIDLSKIPVKKYIPEENGEIHVCAVAQFQYWHGYERFLIGMKEYYKRGGTRNIICQFVGNGLELPKYQTLVKQLNLENHVFFLGFLSGDELLDVYNNSTIALGSFGMYKKNLNYSCDLKSRESLGRGIPMIVGSKTEGFDKDTYKYYYEYPNDSSIIDVAKIIEFHDRIYSEENGQDVVNNIRAYGEKIADIKACMQPVISYLKNV